MALFELKNPKIPADRIQRFPSPGSGRPSTLRPIDEGAGLGPAFKLPQRCVTD